MEEADLKSKFNYLPSQRRTKAPRPVIGEHVIMEIFERSDAVQATTLRGLSLQQLVDFLSDRFKRHRIASGVKRCQVRESFQELSDGACRIVRKVSKNDIVTLDAVFLASITLRF